MHPAIEMCIRDSVCSRLVVMRDRQVVGELRGSDLNQSSIMKTIAGGEQA